MTEGNIPKKSAEQRARLRAKKAVRRHGMESEVALRAAQQNAKKKEGR